MNQGQCHMAIVSTIPDSCKEFADYVLDALKAG